jgi:hypothetical protein
MKMSYLIYKHTLLLDCDYKGWSYIGQTVQKPSRRWRSDGRGYKDQAFGEVINTFGWENFSHEILAENIKTITEANKLEEYYIKYFHTYVGDPECRGFNISAGGHNRDNYGKAVYQLDINKTILNEFVSVSAAARAVNTDPSVISRCCSDPERHAFALGYFWCFVSEYEKFTPRGFNNKAIYQLDKHKNIINRFESISEAGLYLGKPKSNNITLCLNGKKASAYGYYWCEVDKYQNFCLTRTDHQKEVFCIELNKVFPSITDAAAAIGVSPSAIFRCCAGKSKTSGGYHWRYEE